MNISLYTIKEVAKLLKLKERTIREWVATERINVVRINGNIRITKQELDRLINKK